MAPQPPTKPKQRHRSSLTGTTLRTAATLALAGAATATALPGIGHAEPRLTPAQVKAKVDAYQREAEEATEKYDGARATADRAQRSLHRLRERRPPHRPPQYGAQRPRRLRHRPVPLRHRRPHPSAGPLRLPRPVPPARLARRPRGRPPGGDHREHHPRGAVAAPGPGRGGRPPPYAARRAGGRGPPQARGPGEAGRGRRAAGQADPRTARPPPPPGHPHRVGAPAPLRRPRPYGRPAARAISFAYGAIGKPYVWGATGPTATTARA